jgi:hypothetical protein
MSVTYCVNADRRMIRTTCSGALTLAEVIEHFRSLSADPSCSGHLDVLLDLSETDTMPESRQFGAVKAELARIRHKVQLGACAIVATRDALFGMMRMFEGSRRITFARRAFSEPSMKQRSGCYCNNLVSTLRIDLLLERRFQCSDSVGFGPHGYNPSPSVTDYCPNDWPFAPPQCTSVTCPWERASA